MFKIIVEEFIKNDIQSVFNILSDHENYKNFSGVEFSILLEKGTEEKNGKGAIRKIGLGTIEFIERIVYFDRPYRMDYRIEKSKPFPIHHEKGEITLKEEGEGTLVKWVSEGRVTIPLLGPLFLDKIVEKRGGKLFCDALGSVEFFLSAND